MRELSHFIGGKHVAGTSGRFADGYQPMTGEVISRIPLASKAEVRAAVENAKAAWPAWAATNPQRRARVLMKFVDLVARDNEVRHPEQRPFVVGFRQSGQGRAGDFGVLESGVEGILHRPVPIQNF